MAKKWHNLSLFEYGRSVINWYYGAPAGTRTPNLLIRSPYPAYYTKYYEAILNNIYSILPHPLTYTKCYWIALNIRADRHLYGHLISSIFLFYVRSCHPLLNIHAIIAKHSVIKLKTASRLVVIETSETPKKHQRKPEIKYKTGLNNDTVCQKGDNIEIE